MVQQRPTLVGVEVRAGAAAERSLHGSRQQPGRCTAVVGFGNLLLCTDHTA